MGTVNTEANLEAIQGKLVAAHELIVSKPTMYTFGEMRDALFGVTLACEDMFVEIKRMWEIVEKKGKR